MLEKILQTLIVSKLSRTAQRW